MKSSEPPPPPPPPPPARAKTSMEALKSRLPEGWDPVHFLIICGLLVLLLIVLVWILLRWWRERRLEH